MKINRKYSLLLSILFVCAALTSANTSAQVQSKAPEENKIEKPKGDDKADKDGKANKKTPTKKQPSGSFNPTEEISEDLSVSFPVDI